ncbi:MAG TPA: penicillin acylase family protein, partial [Flavisolibacter sp.]
MRILILLLFPVVSFSQSFSTSEINRFRAQAQRVTIIQDQWGVPHMYGKTDADAVFGLMYVQAQLNFKQVEENFLEMLGRLSEVHGENELYADLGMKMVYDTAAA